MTQTAAPDETTYDIKNRFLPGIPYPLSQHELDIMTLKDLHLASIFIRDFVPGEAKKDGVDAVIVVRMASGEVNRIFTTRAHVLALLATINSYYAVEVGSNVAKVGEEAAIIKRVNNN